jgi:hypothetical protein
MDPRTSCMLGKCSTLSTLPVPMSLFPAWPSLCSFILYSIVVKLSNFRHAVWLI